MGYTEHDCRYCGGGVMVDEYGRGEIPADVPPAHGVFCSVECHARHRRADRQRILKEMGA